MSIGASVAKPAAKFLLLRPSFATAKSQRTPAGVLVSGNSGVLQNGHVPRLSDRRAGVAGGAGTESGQAVPAAMWVFCSPATQIPPTTAATAPKAAQPRKTVQAPCTSGRPAVRTRDGPCGDVWQYAGMPTGRKRRHELRARLADALEKRRTDPIPKKKRRQSGAASSPTRVSG